MTTDRGSHNGDDVLHSDLAVIYRAPRIPDTQVARQRSRLEGYVDVLEAPRKRSHLPERARDFFSVVGIAMMLLGIVLGCFEYFSPQQSLRYSVKIAQNVQKDAAAPSMMIANATPAGHQWKEANPTPVFGLSPDHKSPQSIGDAAKPSAAMVAGVEYIGTIVRLPSISKTGEADARIDTAGTSVLRFSLGCDDASAAGSSAHLNVTGDGGIVLGTYAARQGDTAQQVEIPLHGSSAAQFAAPPSSNGQCYLDILNPTTR